MMELVVVIQHHESKCATTKQDNTQVTHGQSSFTHNTPTNKQYPFSINQQPAEYFRVGQ
jgi:hypothetical protein